MKKSVAIAGNSGPKVRSDCEIALGIKIIGGILQLILFPKSKLFMANQ